MARSYPNKIESLRFSSLFDLSRRTCTAPTQSTCMSHHLVVTHFSTHVTLHILNCFSYPLFFFRFYSMYGRTVQTFYTTRSRHHVMPHLFTVSPDDFAGSHSNRHRSFLTHLKKTSMYHDVPMHCTHPQHHVEPAWCHGTRLLTCRKPSTTMYSANTIQTRQCTERQFVSCRF